ncbi:hypothetical protein GCM10007377_13270 [Galliscardovia ingluviei]|uniref:Uncharacterized protein n=1 Tax=Galliscardovia ingluviei TaxID=1769422 RepID=A0A8J3AIB8_9BIFI|nr:hypothetical protein [Galliscardovia ingluviei]GGI14908.1 hypothetical protein GCM10007377_13270 [Galliscardovia ingluviei]
MGVMGIVLIVVWVAIIVAAVAAILMHARKESHQSDSMYGNGNSAPKRPRVVSTQIAYTPSTAAMRGDTAGEELNATSENPVYVNESSSVVEVRALRHPSAAATSTTSSSSAQHAAKEQSGTKD